MIAIEFLLAIAALACAADARPPSRSTDPDNFKERIFRSGACDVDCLDEEVNKHARILSRMGISDGYALINAARLSLLFSKIIDNIEHDHKILDRLIDLAMVDSRNLERAFRAHFKTQLENHVWSRMNVTMEFWDTVLREKSSNTIKALRHLRRTWITGLSFFVKFEVKGTDVVATNIANEDARKLEAFIDIMSHRASGVMVDLYSKSRTICSQHITGDLKSTFYNKKDAYYERPGFYTFGIDKYIVALDAQYGVVQYMWEHYCTDLDNFYSSLRSNIQMLDMVTLVP